MAVGLGVALWVAYFAGLQIFAHQTPGKSLMKLEIGTLDERPPRWPAILVRNALLPTPFWLLSLLTIPFDRHGRALMDMVAGTVVVRDEEAIEFEGWPMPPDEVDGDPREWPVRVKGSQGDS